MWDAARELLAWVLAHRGELELPCGGKRVLELGSGTGWLGMSLAQELDGLLARVHLTEMDTGNALGWLSHNVEANRRRGVRGIAAVSVGIVIVVVQ